MEDSDDIRSSVQHGIDVLAQQRGADTQPDENAAERVRQATDLIRDQATTTSDLIRLYDTWAEKYDQDLFQVWGYTIDKHLDEFEDMTRLPKDARILDLAAGTGIVGEILQARGYTNLNALDGSQGMLDVARERGVYRRYIHALVEDKPIPGIAKDTYDAVVCVGALTNLTPDCFKPLVSITKPGGYIFFLVGEKWIRLHNAQAQFETRMRELVDEGAWRWVLMKLHPDEYHPGHHPLLYCFRVL